VRHQAQAKGHTVAYVPFRNDEDAEVTHPQPEIDYDETPNNYNYADDHSMWADTELSSTQLSTGSADIVSDGRQQPGTVVSSEVYDGAGNHLR
jgi:hypothetical protein